MCRVQYTMCPEEVDCSGSTPVTGNIQLYLPGKFHYSMHVYIMCIHVICNTQYMCLQWLFYCSLSTVVVEVEDPGRVYTDEVSEVTLSCEIYGYPRDSSPPVWTSTSDELQSGRFTTTVTDVSPLNGSSISTTERVVSQLTIFCVSERDSGEYTCSVQGNSTTVALNIIDRGTARYLLIIISIRYYLKYACFFSSYP